MYSEQYLKLLAVKYPNEKAATEEIINLSAILSLPKGTEYYLSDLHGEHEAFCHMVTSASGVIRMKIDENLGDILTSRQRDILASLIYNPHAELERRKSAESDYEQWCRETILHLVVICRAVSTKYTRSKVRRRLPKYSDYIIDELLHADDEANRAYYYTEIINSIVRCGKVDEFIVDFAATISRLAVDTLHIIGDIWDRGAHPDKIMDFLMDFHDVDFQWGNHDIVWIGAASGNWACIANVVRMNVSYNNFDMLEVGYGINLRPLASFAAEVYADDPCTYFMPHILENNVMDPVEDTLAAKMNKAISIIQFKIEGQKIAANPDYSLEHRMLLDKIDLKKGTVAVEGKEYELRDTNFPTVDPADPYALTEGELSLIKSLEASFVNSEKLQRHIGFIIKNGGMYRVQNRILMYHGCIPMDENGDFINCPIENCNLGGRELMEYFDKRIRDEYCKARTNRNAAESGAHSGSDIAWYLWLGKYSPLFGKDRMTTFERFFIADKRAHKENAGAYYKLIDDKKICEKILENFGLDPSNSKILNGHVPVKFKDGESPAKGGGLLFVIDGGMSKSYQKKTGIAGYTFIFNSRFMALSEHKPYSPMRADGSQEFFTPTIKTVEMLNGRMLIKDTDKGRELIKKIEDLEALAAAYRSGALEEVYEAKCACRDEY